MSVSTEALREKFSYCLSSIEEVMGFDLDATGGDYFVGGADYDPLTSEFIDELCMRLSTNEISILYLDFDTASVCRREIPKCDNLTKLQVRHSGLYGGVVEGSYFAIDNKYLWSIFYDASEDRFLLHVKDSRCLEGIRDFLL